MQPQRLLITSWCSQQVPMTARDYLRNSGYLYKILWVCCSYTTVISGCPNASHHPCNKTISTLLEVRRRASRVLPTPEFINRGPRLRFPG